MPVVPIPSPLWHPPNFSRLVCRITRQRVGSRSCSTFLNLSHFDGREAPSKQSAGLTVRSSRQNSAKTRLEDLYSCYSRHSVSQYKLTTYIPYGNRGAIVSPNSISARFAPNSRAMWAPIENWGSICTRRYYSRAKFAPAPTGPRFRQRHSHAL